MSNLEKGGYNNEQENFSYENSQSIPEIDPLKFQESNLRKVENHTKRTEPPVLITPPENPIENFEKINGEFEKSDLNLAINYVIQNGTDKFEKYSRSRDKELVKILKQHLFSSPEGITLLSKELSPSDRKNIAPYIHDFLQEKRLAKEIIADITDYLKLVGKP